MNIFDRRGAGPIIFIRLKDDFFTTGSGNELIGPGANRVSGISFCAADLFIISLIDNDAHLRAEHVQERRADMGKSRLDVRIVDHFARGKAVQHGGSRRGVLRKCSLPAEYNVFRRHLFSVVEINVVAKRKRPFQAVLGDLVLRCKPGLRIPLRIQTEQRVVDLLKENTVSGLICVVVNVQGKDTDGVRVSDNIERVLCLRALCALAAARRGGAACRGAVAVAAACQYGSCKYQYQNQAQHFVKAHLVHFCFLLFYKLVGCRP